MAQTVYPSTIAVATWAQVKNHVFKDATATRADDEVDALCMVLNGVSAAVEAHVRGPIVTRAFANELHDGGGEQVALWNRPIVAVSAVEEEDEALTEGTDFYVYKQGGYLLRAAGGGLLWWAKGNSQRSYTGSWTSKPQGVDVSYTAGRATQTGAGATLSAVAYTNPRDEVIRLAALLWIAEIWGTGPANLANIISEGGVVSPAAIPPQVRDMLKPILMENTL